MMNPSYSRSIVQPAIALFVFLISFDLGWPGPMTDDPKGFRDIPWGTPLSSRQDMELLRSGPHIVEYLFTTEPSSFAGAEMTSIRCLSLDDQFARVVIRYEGDQIHRQVLDHLESRFGRLARIPGQMARGLTQQYNWRGADTEINLTYQAGTALGYIFIDSRTLAPRFNDDMTDSAE